MPIPARAVPLDKWTGERDITDPSLEGSSQITVYFELKGPVTFFPRSEKTRFPQIAGTVGLRAADYSRGHKSFAKTGFTMFSPRQVRAGGEVVS
jgi:hypothetical protein